jgi:NAD-dependent deacetylase sirtuin 2
LIVSVVVPLPFAHKMTDSDPIPESASLPTDDPPSTVIQVEPTDTEKTIEPVEANVEPIASSSSKVENGELDDKSSEPESLATADNDVQPAASSAPASSLASSKLEDLLAAMMLNNEEEHLMSVLSEYLGPTQSSEDDLPTSSDSSHKLRSLDMDGVVEYLQSESCRNVIVMVGAGISTSAGIPDFRSPDSGIYSKLARHNLPSPECVFEINYFRNNPKPFFELAKELFDYDRCRPTPCHAFIRLLHQKRRLLRLYTQNIDGLEYEAGLDEETVIAAHGSFHKSRCLACRKEYDFEHIRSHLFDRPDGEEVTIPRCDECPGRPHNIIKPNIVFFGEQLPAAFYDMQSVDFPKCDLLLIVGTSLSVQPFAGLIDAVTPEVPRVLINREKCGTSSRLHNLMGIKSGLEFNLKDNYRDVFLQGDCDSVCRELVDKLGWTDEFELLLQSIRDPKSS